MIITVHKNKYCRGSKRTSIGGRVRLIKFPYNGINKVQRMSIPVVSSQNAFY